ncbi:unnamed protein product [Rotaria sp. Silwood1]|nr:unnamed protein product [Rotaria sp. Silwood1]CAF1671908.1 unnamed protein product [Rotaria sp. Silwood1]CAF3867318.1 unnamed protein product [Rotaria sp. Silwood1]CAF4003322.1 unnamed protein product [Rotaria sp. Silwood1]CAF4919857.1 unnamed protein product [Rotaria sp. Silwood1]
MSEKKHRLSLTKHHVHRDKQANNRIFSDIDVNTPTMSNYDPNDQPSPIDQPINQHLIPTGVVDTDETVEIPIRSSNSHRQHHTKQYRIIRPTQVDDSDDVHLPSIHNHSHKHHPYEYHHHHHHHHDHSIHNKHDRYRYDSNGRTYDPRWWYMPINSVHGPISQRRFDYHYVPPKWYELPSRH